MLCTPLTHLLLDDEMVNWPCANEAVAKALAELQKAPH